MEREVVKCRARGCKLYARPQFFTRNGCCRCCGAALHVPVPRSEKPKEPEPPASAELQSTISKQVRAVRIWRGMTQASLARQAGNLSRSHLSRFERGDYLPHAGVLSRLAQAMRVPICVFFGNCGNCGNMETVELTVLFTSLLPTQQAAVIEKVRAWA